MTKADRKRMETIAKACGWVITDWYSDKGINVYVEGEQSPCCFEPTSKIYGGSDLLRAIKTLRVPLALTMRDGKFRATIRLNKTYTVSHEHRLPERSIFLALADAAKEILKERKGQ